MLDQASQKQALSVPVVLIIFRRPLLTRQVLEAIAVARPSTLFVIADGPRPDIREDAVLVSEARQVIANVDWECRIHEIYSDTNLGLRDRIVSGLDQVFSVVEEAIILEDDCLPDPSFFWFSQEVLRLYKSNSSVGLISGNNFSGLSRTTDSYYFSRSANIWGWATWRRTWETFRSSNFLDANPEEFSSVISTIEPKKTRKYLEKLASQISQLDSWALPFSIFFHSAGLLSVVPATNLVKNIGFGEGSTHTKFESWAHEVETQALPARLQHPASVQVDAAAMNKEIRAIRNRWLTFPLSHPLEAFSRVFRYFLVRFYRPSSRLR